MGSLGVRPLPSSTLMWRCPLARVGTSFLLTAALCSPTAGPAPALRRPEAPADVGCSLFAALIKQFAVNIREQVLA